MALPSARMRRSCSVLTSGVFWFVSAERRLEDADGLGANRGRGQQRESDRGQSQGIAYHVAFSMFTVSQP